jgi:hypothetical protein
MSFFQDWSVIDSVTIGPAIVFRARLASAGAGIPGLTPTVAMTDPDGADVALVLNTDYLRFERTNIVGDYELRIALTKFATHGVYSIAIISGDPGVGDLVDSIAVDTTFVKVNDASATTTAFIISRLNGPALSSVANFYKDCYFSPVTGALRPGGPKKCTSYDGGTLTPTVEAFSSAPANGVVMELVR